MNENKQKVWVIIVEVILLILGFAAIVLHMSSAQIDGVDIMYLGVFGLLIFYALAGYIIPHGNLLKYLMLLFAASIAMEPIVKGAPINYIAIVTVLCAVAIAYIAGRLNRLNTNLWQMLAVLVVLVAMSVCTIFNIGGEGGIAVTLKADGIIYQLMPAIQWAFITYFYAARFKSHKEEGEKENAELAAASAEENK